MIFTHDDKNFSDDECDQITRDYFAFVHKEHLPICSVRGWDYATAILNADLRSDKVVLDVGCACSYFFLYIARLVAVSYGIDIIDGYAAQWAVPWEKSILEYDEFLSGRTKFTKQNAASLPYPDDFFDVVFTFSALEHFEGSDDSSCAREISRALKPNGVFLGTVDFNSYTEKPQGEGPGVVCRAYTSEAFYRRIVVPSGLQLSGKDFVLEKDFPSLLEKPIIDLFFMLRK